MGVEEAGGHLHSGNLMAMLDVSGLEFTRYARW